MRILITGSAGFLGSHIAERFENDGHDVSGVDNGLTGRFENWPDTVRVDITARHRFYETANRIKPDLVIHCAASYSDPNLWHRDIATNVEGTVNALLVARHHGARLFYFQTALPPISSYAISKIAGERYIEMATDVPSVIFRLANIYGPRNLSGPIPAFWRRLSAREQCTVVETTREMVFVDDLVDAVMTVARRPEVRGRIDFCSGRPAPIREIYDLVAHLLDSDAEPIVLQPDDDDVVAMELNPLPARFVLDWEPKTPLAEGVLRAVEWYEQHGVTQAFTHLRVQG